MGLRGALCPLKPAAVDIELCSDKEGARCDPAAARAVDIEVCSDKEGALCDPAVAHAVDIELCSDNLNLNLYLNLHLNLNLYLNLNLKSGATRLGALCCMKPREMHWKSSTTIGLSTPHRMKPFEMRWKSGATIGSGADDHKADDEAE